MIFSTTPDKLWPKIKIC